jgi:hypothetical protein
MASWQNDLALDPVLSHRPNGNLASWQNDLELILLAFGALN